MIIINFYLFLMEIVLGNRYYLGKKIGSGAFGTIYEGTFLFITLKVNVSKQV